MALIVTLQTNNPRESGLFCPLFYADKDDLSQLFSFSL